MNRSRRTFLERAALSGGALAAGLRSPAFAQALDPIVVAAIPSDISGSAYYAQDRGFFKQVGLEATFASLNNGAAITSAVVGGSAQLGYSNVISLAIAHTRGLPITILFPANMHVSAAPTAGLLAVAQASPIRSAKDMNGKVMAVSGLNNIADIAGRAWIDEGGGDSKTVKSVELPFSAMKAALEAGHIDAAAMDQTGDPELGKPGDALRVLASTFDAVSHRFAPSVWFSTTDWVAKNRAQTKAAVTAMRNAAQWANTHHAESAAILAKWTHDSVEQIESITRVTYGEALIPGLIQPNIDIAAKYGVLKASFPATEMISASVS